MTDTPKDPSSEMWPTMVPGAAILSSAVLVADAQSIIRFVNPAAKSLLRAMASVFRGAGNALDLSGLEGAALDRISLKRGKAQARRRTLTSRTEETQSFENTHLGFVWTPFFDAEGTFAGTVMEILDRSDIEIKAARRKTVETEYADLLGQIRAMTLAHSKGEIDIFIDPECFTIESLADAARCINETVAGHIATKRKFVDVMQSFAAGNFDAQIEQFSGQRAFINDAVEAVRSNFREVVAEIGNLSDAIVAGKLDVRPDFSKFKGEYLQIVQSFDAAFAGLNNAFSVMGEQIDQVSISVEQISHASQVLSTSSQIASASVEEVSASVHQTDQQVRANAQASQKAAEYVGTAVGLTTRGSAQIGDMVEAMKGIKTSSEDIAKIIKVIDEIAFQTNLLALNAAVEAARAGQHGRGFAVVAQEVRNLAGRSAKAAQETSDLIEDAANRVSAGVQIADDTSEAFKSIAEQMNLIKVIVEEIDGSSEEQSRGVAQISLAMNEISKTALDTSQQSDELAAGAAEMSSATETMKAAIDRFSLRPQDATPGLDDLGPISADMMAQIQMMLYGSAPETQAPRVTSSIDRDERGFGRF